MLLILVVGLFAALGSINTLFEDVTNFRKKTFYVVSPSYGSEKFYLKLKRMGAKNEQSQLREDVICAAILKSSFFSADNGVEMVDPISDEESYSTFDPVNNWYMFTRPYKTVNVSVLQTVIEEAVFPCLAKFKATNQLTLYLISHEYDFGRWVQNETFMYLTCVKSLRGRFVFEYNQDRRITSLLAVAEQPVLVYGECGRPYSPFGVKDVTPLAMSERSQAICTFTTGRKIRICAVVLNNREYRKRISFLPQECNIEPQCEKKEFTFERAQERAYSWGRKRSLLSNISLWVIGCTAQRVRKLTPATYYVSLGWEPYQLVLNQPKETASLNQLTTSYSYLGTDNPDYNDKTRIIEEMIHQ